MTRMMKSTDIEWIGEIPENWDIRRVKYIFTKKDAKAEQEDPVVLSLARSGVKVRDISTNEGQIAASYYNYNPVAVGDLLLNPMDLYSGANCSISKVEGVISPAYVNLKNKHGYNSVYYDYFFKTMYWSFALFSLGKGVSFDNRWTLGNDTLFNIKLPAPPTEEQQKIAEFLDEKCGAIDEIISKTEQSIEEYKKLKQSVITKAVTKGIRPNRPMQDSNIEWIGEIPTDWDVTMLKRNTKINNGREIENEVASDYENAVGVYGSGGIFEYTDRSLHNGEAVMFGRKGTLGKPIYVNGRFWTVDTMYYLTYKVLLLAKFNYYQLIAFDWEPFITHTAIPSIVATDIVAQKFPLPPLDEQKEIADYLDEKCSEIDTLIEKKQQFLAEMANYKKSLIYEYVTGKKEVA